MTPSSPFDVNGLGAPAFFALTAGLAAAGVPVLPLGVAAGAVFGPWLGAALFLAAGATGSSVNFLVLRRVTGLIPESALPERWKNLSAALKEDGAWVVVLARLSPVCPFGAATAVFAASGPPFARFAGASLLGLTPAALVYAHAGYLGREALSGAGGQAYRAAGIIATAALIWAGHRLLMRALASRGA